MASKQTNKGQQGFASMDEEKQREIASKGGRTKHKGEAPENTADHEDNEGQDHEEQNNRHANKGKQGFASMDPEKQREIASKGGRASHRGDDADEDLDEDADESEDVEASDAADLDESEDLDELLSLLEESELTDLDPEEGIELIDEWYEIVNDAGDAKLKEIAKGLKQLKKVLSASKSKPAAIAEALSHLGEQTDDYANQAPRGYKTKLHQLGKTLNKAGRSLEQEEE